MSKLTRAREEKRENVFATGRNVVMVKALVGERDGFAEANTWFCWRMSTQI